MSEIGVLSQDYQNTADLFRAVNQAVILVKKRYYRLAGAVYVSDQQLSEARQSLLVIVNELIANLEATDESKSVGVSVKEGASIPPLVVRRIEDKHQGDLRFYLEDLHALGDALYRNESLTEEHIQYLDELCEQFDAETSALHRRLWRK